MKCPKFTREQVDWICSQIPEWYLAIQQLESTDNFDHIKEKIKTIICPVRQEEE